MYDISRLTLGEIAKIEDLSGRSISEFGNDESPKGRALAALTFVVARRSGKPDFKFEDAMNLDMKAAYEILGISDDDEEEAPKE